MAGLTKQHFEKIAEIIKLTCDNESQRVNLTYAFSNYLKTQNPLFNDNQFKKACLE